jgi:alanyl-tRNA synthetase
MLTGSEIRRKFLDFFVQKGHREVHSSSLVPQNDPTLLFTNAGMNQFKDIFLGLEKRDYNRATTSQKCVRAGGKHNDLENVGFTNRHHTFFEMLGNFSFGDYFKKDAIAYAWELITSTQWFGIDKSKLYVTIFNGEGGMQRDTEAYDLWIGQGVPKDRIFEFGLKDNFWQMGDTGPCGPCSEIHYDMGVVASDQSHTDCAFGCDCGRYVELWNLVFMQFDRDVGGKLNPLPKPSIDTGMGLERVTAVLQGVISNYDTDLFMPLINGAAHICGISGSDAQDFDLEKLGRKVKSSLRIIADHSRATCFLVQDGVAPSNEGRGYVLRKIMRRAMRHARLIGGQPTSLVGMVDLVVEEPSLRDAYPELREGRDRIANVVLAEARRFEHTLAIGLKRLEELLDEAEERRVQSISKFLGELSQATRGAIGIVLADYGLIQTQDAAEPIGKYQTLTSVEDLARFAGRCSKTLGPTLGMAAAKEFMRIVLEPAVLSGEDAFRLYDTYGLPLDFMTDAARDRRIKLDQEGFDSALQDQRERAKKSWKGKTKQIASPEFANLPHTVFEGYSDTKSSGSEVIAILHKGLGRRELREGEDGEVILDHTPFYAESGGQVGDRGWLYGDDHSTVVADVKGCYYPIQGVRAHQITTRQPIRVGQKVDAVVDTEIRQATMRNHTATHLLQAGLREVLGKHVKQAGSLVAPNHLRFDFSHFTSVADEELQDIEDLINKEVLRNQKIEVIENVPIDVAINEYKAMALFGEKYGDKVRVIKIGDFSTELCGGTHTGATGEIGLIKVLKEGSVSSGVRRIEAVTGEGSLHHFQKDHQLENVVASLTTREANASPAEALKLELEKKDAEIKRLARELDQARMKSASSTVASVTDQIKDVRGIKVLAHRVDNLERAQMRTLVDQLRDKLGSGVVVLGSATNGSVALIVGVTKDLTSKIQAGKVIGPVAQKVGGKGGGRPDLAEAGGKDPAALDAALGEVYGVVDALLEK